MINPNRKWFNSLEDAFNYFHLTARDRAILEALVMLVGAPRAYLNPGEDFIGYALPDGHDTVVLMQRKASYITIPKRAGVFVDPLVYEVRPTTHNIEAGGVDVRLSEYSRDWPGDSATRGTGTSKPRKPSRKGRQPWEPCLTCGTDARNGWRCIGCEQAEAALSA